MTLCTAKHRKRICTYLSHIQKDYIINMDYVCLGTNLYIHHVRLSRNLYIHYVRLSTSLKLSQTVLPKPYFGSHNLIPSLPVLYFDWPHFNTFLECWNFISISSLSQFCAIFLSSINLFKLNSPCNTNSNQHDFSSGFKPHTLRWDVWA